MQAACGKHTAADVVAKAQAVLSEAEVLRAMFDVDYFPPNTPPTKQTARRIAANIAKLTSAPRQILKDIPRPPNSASRDD